MTMKKIAICLTGLFLTVFASRAAAKENEFAASDSRITYIGRTETNGADVSFDWSGTTVRIKFTGRSLALKCSDTGRNYYNVWIDRTPGPNSDRIICTAGTDTTIVLTENSGKGTHSVILQKRTEGEQGKTTFSAFITDGTLSEADPIADRLIEFIGDSYTCGFGTENSTAADPFKAETENCNLTYAAIASRYFNADFVLVSHSGQGIARNYDEFGKGYNMPDRYTQTFDGYREPKWNAAEGYRPDLVVVYLGTNDFSTDRQPSFRIFKERYIELLSKVKENYGDDISIICMAPKADPCLLEYVKASCEACGLKNIHYMSLQDSVHDNCGDLGASWHPNYKGQKKVASCLIPYISTVTGWEMEEKPYR